MEEIEITVGNGEISVNWWTPESGDLICDLCGECEGWRKVQDNWFEYGIVNSCPHANPLCG